MASPELQRQVSQNKNDVLAIYDLLRHTNEQVGSIDTKVASLAVGMKRHDNRFDEIQQTLDLHGTRLNRLDESLREQGARLNSLETKVDSLDTRFGTLETRVGTIETKVETIGSQMTEVLTILRGARTTS